VSNFSRQFRLTQFGLIALVAAACSLPPLLVHAHHSFALFDQTKTITIKGVVGRFDWTNPHVTVYVDVPGSPTKRYKLESGSVNALTRQGWKPDAIKVGNQVEASFHPLKTGEQPGGLILEIKTGDVVLKGGG
jgi:hypothetical protein